MQNLYDFTQDAMKKAATGRVEDLAAWTSADYNIRYLNLVQTRRPMVRRTMGNVDLTKVHMGGQPLPPAPAPARKRRSEGMLLFFKVILPIDMTVFCLNVSTSHPMWFCFLTDCSSVDLF